MTLWIQVLPLHLSAGPAWLLVTGESPEDDNQWVPAYLSSSQAVQVTQLSLLTPKRPLWKPSPL